VQRPETEEGESAVHVLSSAPPGSAWTFGGSILTFAIPMILTIAVLGALWVLYTKPELVPGRPAGDAERPVSYTPLPQQPAAEAGQAATAGDGAATAEAGTAAATADGTGQAVAAAPDDSAAAPGDDAAAAPEDSAADTPGNDAAVPEDSEADATGDHE
jgi:hypothetical protein